MSFKEWLLTEHKYVAYGSAACEHCKSNLLTYEITKNPHHMYEYGQLWKCNCTKSSIWTNSVRNEDRLLAFFDGKEDRYINGFCNDLFCGNCYKSIQPLKNGVPSIVGNRNADRYGCMKCQQNQNIQIDGFKKAPEGDASVLEILEWYRRHRKQLEQQMSL